MDHEYPSLGAPALDDDLARAEEIIAQIAALSLELERMEPAEALAAAGRIYALEDEAGRIAWDALSFARAAQIRDGRDALARRRVEQGRALFARLNEARLPLDRLLAEAPQDAIEGFLAAPANRPWAPDARRIREEAAIKLPPGEEALVGALDAHGPLAWQGLYESLAAGLACDVAPPGRPAERMGLGAAAKLLVDPDEGVRRAAAEARERAWAGQRELCAVALNAIVGWRTEIARRRRGRAPAEPLDLALRRNRLGRAALDAMRAALERRRDVGWRANDLRARALGKERLDEWDMGAPSPAADGEQPRWDLAAACEVIAEVSGSFSPEMAGVFRRLAGEGRVEDLSASGRRAGAVNLRFPRAGTSRVLLPYTPGLWSVRVLAHELGHAFHAWATRDLALSESSYPPALAEIASTFTETLVFDALAARYPGAAASLRWADLQAAELYLLNVPMYLDFEIELHDRRAAGALSPDELTALGEAASRRWYGGSLGAHRSLFWASNAHLYKQGVGFRSFPYAVAYLLSLAIDARRERLGSAFYPSYLQLLRDSGRMTVEELAREHLGADLAEPAPWLEGIAAAERRIDAFAALQPAAARAEGERRV